MTDTPNPPEGWYPDPAGSGGLRRWSGTGWTDDVRSSAPEAALAGADGADEPGRDADPRHDADPRRDATAGWDTDDARREAPAVPDAPTTPETPAATEAAVAPAAPPAYVPTPPGAPSPGASSGAGAAPAYAAYPGAAPAAAAPVRREIPTDTVWIWLIVALPLVGVLSLFLFDWRGYVDASIYSSLYPEATPMVLSSTLGVTVGASAISLLIAGLSVLFAFLDWRALRARGVERPFHWAWSLFVFVITSGIYVIGRGVILRRQTGKGLGPVWAWIAVTVVSIVIVIVWGLLLLAHVFEVLEQLGLVY